MDNRDLVLVISNKLWSKNPKIKLTHGEFDDLVEQVMDELDSWGFLRPVEGEDD